MGRSYKREASHAVYENRVKCARAASGQTFILGSVRWKFSTQHYKMRHLRSLGLRLGLVFGVPKQQTLGTFDRVEFCGGALIDCYTSNCITVVSVPHGGETISVTLAFCTSPSSATQLFSGHGGRLDIIVTVCARPCYQVTARTDSSQ